MTTYDISKITHINPDGTPVLEGQTAAEEVHEENMGGGFLALVEGKFHANGKTSDFSVKVFIEWDDRGIDVDDLEISDPTMLDDFYSDPSQVTMAVENCPENTRAYNAFHGIV